MANLVFRKVPFPGYLDHQAMTADKPEGLGWDNIALWGDSHRTPMFVVLHRMVGTMAGTDSEGWFGSPTVGALTDYGIGTANIDGKGLDGVIVQWNDPRGYRVPWASGPVSQPYGDGLKWLNWSGNHWDYSICNACGVSIENSGNYGDSETDFAFGELAKFVAYWFDQFGIAWDKAPIHPVTGFSAICWHREFTIGTGKTCPGSWIMDHTDALISAASAIMKEYQTGNAGVDQPAQPAPQPAPAPQPKYAKPQPIKELAQLGKADHDKAQAVITAEGAKFIYVADRVKAKGTTRRLQHADEKSAAVGPDMKAGEEADVWYIFTAKDGKDYYYTPWHTRLLASDFERVGDTPAFAQK